MTEPYNVTVRCDHGEKKPRIARATFDGEAWSIKSVWNSWRKTAGRRGRAGLIDETSPTFQNAPQNENQVVKLVGNELDSTVRNRVLPPYPENADFEALQAYSQAANRMESEIEAASRSRIAIECDACMKKVVGEPVVRMFEEARANNVHTVVL